MGVTVSVIVPCFDQEAYLAECLDSVLAQTYTNWECIIINDGSIDNSETIAKSYVKKDGRFKYIYQENQGVVVARNNAIRQSTGKYILPLDGDDKIAPEYLALAVHIMEKDDTIRLVYCDVELFGEKNKKYNLLPMNLRNILFAGCCVCTSLFRKKDFDEIGGFRENMKDGWEDWDFFISILELGDTVEKIEKTLFYYRVVPKSRNKIINPEIKTKLEINKVLNHPLSFHNEYSKLFEDYMKYENCSLTKDTLELVYQHPLFCKLIHANIIFVKILRRMMNYLKI